MGSFSEYYRQWQKEKSNINEPSSGGSFSNYYDEWKKKKKEEEEKKLAEQEQQKKISQEKKQSLKTITSEDISTSPSTNKEIYSNSFEARKQQQNNSKSLKSKSIVHEASSNNSQPIYSTEKLKQKHGELQEITAESLRTDEKAKKRADEINKSLEEKDYLRAGGFVLEGLGEGIRSAGAGIGEAGLDIAALGMGGLEKISPEGKVKDFFAKSKDKLIDNAKYLNDNTSYYQKALNMNDNGIVRTSGQVSNVIGEMLGSGGNNILMGISAGGQAATENVNTDRDNLGKSILTGIGKGGIAYYSNKIVGGDFISKGIVDKLAAKGISKTTANNVAKNVLWKAYQVMGEQAEEILEDSVGNVIDKVINDKDLPSFKEWLNQESETAKITGISTLVLSALGLGGADIRTTLNEGRTANEQKVYDTLIENKTNEMKTQKAIDNMIKEQQVKLKELYGRDLTSEEIIKIKEAVNETNQAGKLDIENTKISNKEKIKIEQEIKNDLTEGNLSIDTIRDILGENVDLTKDNILQRSLYENSQRYEDYKFEFTGNEKVDSFLQSARDAGVNNTTKTRKKIELISKLVENTDRQYRFINQEQLKENGYNENANGLNNNGEILLNVNSNKEIVAVVGHETTHLFDGKVQGEYTQEYKYLQSAVTNFLKANGSYETKINEIIDTYSKAGIELSQDEIMEELTADTIGDNLFGENAESFIQHLTTNRNVFQKIYDYIKKAVVNIKGYKSEEARQLQNLKDTFDRVYKTLNKAEINTDTKYSIAGKKGMNNAIKQDTSNLIIEQSYNRALQLAKNGTDNETIRKTTNWFQDKNGDWKFEFSDKNMALKNTKLEQNKTYKLGNILEHDILFEVYPELKNYEVAFKQMNNINGSFNRNSNKIKLNNDMVENDVSIKGTLIHEIQHAIQKIEGFEGGKSSKNSKLAYLQSLGEIEADDTKRRYLAEKYGNLDTNKIPPKSSQSNPKHSQLNSYLENRGVIDKIKDGIYNYFSIKNSGRINNENNYIENKEINKQSKGEYSGLVVGRKNLDIDADVKYSISQDNQGRTLTKEQQEYFKDSKVKDENGNLKEVYHGTPYEFNQFNYSKLGENTSSLGAGFYFTDRMETAEEYNRDGGNVKTVYIDIKKPLKYGETTITKSEYKLFIEGINEETNGTYLEDYDGIDNALMEYDYGGDDIDLVLAVHNASGLTYEKTYEILRKTIGYDGIISDKGFLNKDETLYVAFNANQIKNVDNTNPTENPDIRFSMTQGETDQYWKKKTLDNEIKNSKKSSFNLDEKVGNHIENVETKTVEEVLNESPEEKQKSMKDKAKKYISRSRTNFINNIVNNFGTSKIANINTLNNITEQIREDIRQNEKITKEQKDKYFNDLYNNLVKIDTQYYDTYKDVKDNIRNTKLYISDNIRGDITDFSDFRKSNMGTLIMTNDSSNISVDQYYQEMSDMYPELFPDNITNPTEQLQKISEIAKDIKKVETNVAAYNDANLGKDYRSWAREAFDKDIDKFVHDIKMAERYNNESNTTDKIGMTKELVKQAYRELPEARRKYEKASAKEVLTKEDRVQVDRLLNNEITVQEIPSGLNKEGIIRLATAKAEYDAIQKSIKEYQVEIKQNRIEQAKADVGNLDSWKDKKLGFAYSRETPIRNIYDVAPKEVADTVLNKYFRPYIETNEKIVIDETNKYFDKVRNLDLSDKKKYKIDFEGKTKKVSESALVQLLGEKKITIDQIKNAGSDSAKIENAVKEFRTLYNEMFEKINESMLDNGYSPVEYRKDYFPHFTEQTTDSLLGKAAKLLGIDISNREELPTDISGQTYQFKPGRTWFSSLLERTTDVTDYDAKKGFEKYTKGAMDLIYHTGDIQNLRALSSAIRGTYNDTEIKNQIQEINENTSLTDLEKAQEVQRIYDTAKDKSHLSKFTEWLDNYINLLAGKKAINDRGAEKELNRKVYKTMTDIESRIAANAIGGNVGVSLTNFAPLSQAWGEVKTHNLINGIWQTMKSSLKGDTSFASESQFITRRRGTDSLTKTNLEKITTPINSILEFADKFTSEAIVRSRYNQNLQKGMNIEQALEEADRYTAGLMADRGRGALPTQFSNKNPMAKMLNMFQVEVNNQWSYYLKDLPKNIQEAANNNKSKIVTNTAVAYTKIMVGSYLINELLGSIRGKSTRVLPDPIYIIKELIGSLTDDDDDNNDDALIGTFTEIIGNLPFISVPATLFADSFGLDAGDIGRIPISGSTPNIKNIVSDLLDGEKSAVEKVKNIGGELLDTVGSSLVLPYGGSQIKKTVKGLSLYNNDIPGSYTKSGDLRYTIDDSIGRKIQAGLFGAYANPYAQDYVDSGYKTIKKENIDEMVGLDMNSTEYREFKKNLSKVSDTSDKNGYKQYKDSNDNIYWYDANSETMYDKNYKKSTLTADDLTKVSKKEEALNYINSLDLTTGQKNLVANNLNKNSKKKINMSEYGNYDSYDEYQYARDYPKKYSVVSQIANYGDYINYKDDIAEIKKQYSTELGYESKERKAAVQNYINELDLNMYQKMMLEKLAGGYSIKNYKNYIYNYLETTELTQDEKHDIWEELFD